MRRSNQVSFILLLTGAPALARNIVSLGLNVFKAWRPSVSRLEAVVNFGSNPGGLRMLTYLPDNLPAKPALVVVLHGSTQSAANYDLGAGWSRLAQEHRFVLLMPEQSRRNNLTRSFNWFKPNDTRREGGEAQSIKQMVDEIVRNHDVDYKRIFITGLSSGGAMTLVMLATYPDVFAAGAVIAGLPYGGARNIPDAIRGMLKAPAKSSSDLGNLVREASPNTIAWPRLSVWHGSADRTVKPSNADEIIKQWLDVHSLPSMPMSEQIVDGHPRQVWRDGDGKIVVESYRIMGMAHGIPLSRSEGDVTGRYMIEAGISSSHRIAEFFGLTDECLEKPQL